jgi:AcrR family transcriptional regulator
MDGKRRPHTGRRRNEAAREAILRAAVDLLARGDTAAISVDTIAAAAGVGKQTIYRWWPSKGAVLLEAAVEQAREQAPPTDTGTLAGDLKSFLTATFRTTNTAKTLLRNAMAEALRDTAAAAVLRDFTAARRTALREILDRAQIRGELRADTDPELLIDQAFGVLWYRLLLEHDPLTPRAAAKLAESLARAASHD